MNMLLLGKWEMLGVKDWWGYDEGGDESGCGVGIGFEGIIEEDTEEEEGFGG